jgi:Opioid growth factor receptor (OGFr) conserved region
MNDDPLVLFYEGNAPDNRGRYLREILAWDDDALEYTHDYIQWLFPITTIGVNPYAPPASSATIDAFRRDPLLRASLRRSFDRMLAFYGLEWSDNVIVRGKDFSAHRQWLTEENHNHLRLTRIMKSLRLLGEEEAAAALLDCLMGINHDEREAGRVTISSTTIRFWVDALA